MAGEPEVRILRIRNGMFRPRRGRDKKRGQVLRDDKALSVSDNAVCMGCASSRTSDTETYPRMNGTPEVTGKAEKNIV